MSSIAFIKEYSSFGSDVDLTADEPDRPLHIPFPSPTIEVVTAGSGGLSVIGEHGAITLTSLIGGERFQIQGLRTIRSSGTTVTRVRVSW